MRDNKMMKSLLAIAQLFCGIIFFFSLVLIQVFHWLRQWRLIFNDKYITFMDIQKKKPNKIAPQLEHVFDFHF